MTNTAMESTTWRQVGSELEVGRDSAAEHRVRTAIALPPVQVPSRLDGPTHHIDSRHRRLTRRGGRIG